MKVIGFETLGVAVSPLPVSDGGGNSYDASAVLGAVWKGLIRGRFAVVECQTSLEFASLRVMARAAVGSALRDRELAAAAFESVVRGEPQKSMALGLAMSPSSLSARLRAVIAAMGLDCKLTKLPLAIPLLAHAVERPELATLHVETTADKLECPTICIRIRRCDHALAKKISESEYAVARQLLEGNSYREIAVSRNTSARTIANQLTSSFRKLKASGRFALLRHAVERATLGPSAGDSATLPSGAPTRPPEPALSPPVAVAPALLPSWTVQRPQPVRERRRFVRPAELVP